MLKKVTWTIAYRGRYCPDYGLDTSECKKREAGQPYEQEASFIMPGITPTMHTYWEPLNSKDEPDWTNWAGTETNDKGISALLDAEYTVPVNSVNASGDVITVPSRRRFKQPFTINTRELRPATGTEKPMQGSDVAILEAMLWQLGISPQKGSIGRSGARINSDRGKNKNGEARGWTQNCDGSDAKVRNIYSGGWDGCDTGKVALEGMVRRFQGRNVKNDSSNEENGGKEQNGIVNNKTLGQLDRAWSQYWQAYVANKSTPEILNSAVTDDWLKEAVKIWESGFSATVGGDSTKLAEATYTDKAHKEMLKAAGLDENAKTREELLRQWKTQETPSHWGQGSPKTGYRITEGNGDEFGSMSFNQVLYQYRYSDQPCKGHKDAALNFYMPVDNIKGFALHTALKPTASDNCPGAFDAAYVRKTLAKTHGTDKPLKYRHSDSGSWKAIPDADDEYELLAKAIGGYNGGLKLLGQHTWAKLISSTRKPTEEERKAKAVNQMGDQCFSCDYSISVRNVKYKLPYRQYLWFGGKEPDQIPVIGTDGKPEKNENGSTKMQVNPKAGQDWCFVYGEQEWISPIKKADETFSVWADYKNFAKVDSTKRLACE